MPGVTQTYNFQLEFAVYCVVYVLVNCTLYLKSMFSLGLTPVV
jgi:hypothetical protein